MSSGSAFVAVMACVAGAAAATNARAEACDSRMPNVPRTINAQARIAAAAIDRLRFISCSLLVLRTTEILSSQIYKPVHALPLLVVCSCFVAGFLRVRFGHVFAGLGLAIVPRAFLVIHA